VHNTQGNEIFKAKEFWESARQPMHAAIFRNAEKCKPLQTGMACQCRGTLRPPNRFLQINSCPKIRIVLVVYSCGKEGKLLLCLITLKAGSALSCSTQSSSPAAAIDLKEGAAGLSHSKIRSSNFDIIAC
jgi:hypothetical protein